MIKDLITFINFIQNEVGDSLFNMTLKIEWSSEAVDYRLKIREHMATINTSYFTREQLAELYNLNQRPQAAQGFVSISHCRMIGGYTYAEKKHGFDVEELNRISDNVIKRTSSEDEMSKAPHVKFLWVAKEAAFKALDADTENTNFKLNITDFVCKNWIETTQQNLWSYQIKSEKEFETDLNIGYVFCTANLLFSVYFK